MHCLEVRCMHFLKVRTFKAASIVFDLDESVVEEFIF